MKKKLLLSNGTSYVIHHRFQTTSRRKRNLPIEQSIYYPDKTNRFRGKTVIFLPKNPKNHVNDKDTRFKTCAILYSTIGTEQLMAAYRQRKLKYLMLIMTFL